MAVLSGRGVPQGRAIADVPSGSNSADVGQKEDLANFISMITRDETPFMSSIGKTKATSIYHEWQTDTLDAPADSKIAEGLDYVIPHDPGDAITSLGGGDLPGQTSPDAFSPIGPFRTRLGNYTQINGKTIAVSGTRRAIDSVGVADEYAYQLKKRGTELRRDLERDLIHSYQIAKRSGTRAMGGFQAWINNGVTARIAFGATGWALPAAGTQGEGNSPFVNSGTPVGAALSLADIDATMQDIYEEGGKASKIMLSPKLRRDFSDLMVTDSGVRRNIDMDGKLRQSVDVYMSDFGDLMVVPNYIMGLSQTTAVADTTVATQASNSAAFIYDSMWFSIATLRPLQEVDVGQRGDSTVGMMVEECTLEVKNPVGCGAIYGLA